MSKRRKAIIALLLIIAFSCGGYSIFYFAKRASVGKVYQDLAKEVEMVQPLVVNTTDEPVAEPIPIDFEKLWEINPEIYAWIQIPGTEINYPIVQSATDNDYYLNHSIEHQAGLPGSIFTENRNSKDFTDYNTIIYGHNMMDRTMFSSLHDYQDLDYFNGHREIIIYTPERKIVYKVFAAVRYTNVSLLDKFIFTSLEMRQSFLASLKDGENGKGTVLAEDENLADRRMITLSTCDDTQGVGRYLVVAVEQE